VGVLPGAPVLCGGMSVLPGLGNVSGGAGAAAISGPDDVDPDAPTELSEVDDEMLGDGTSNVGADEDDPEDPESPGLDGPGSLGAVGNEPVDPIAVAAGITAAPSIRPAAIATRTALSFALKVRLLRRPCARDSTPLRLRRG
jgi:hypothetical protein